MTEKPPACGYHLTIASHSIRTHNPDVIMLGHIIHSATVDNERHFDMKVHGNSVMKSMFLKTDMEKVKINEGSSCYLIPFSFVKKNSWKLASNILVTPRVIFTLENVIAKLKTMCHQMRQIVWSCDVHQHKCITVPCGCCEVLQLGVAGSVIFNGIPRPVRL